MSNEIRVGNPSTQFKMTVHPDGSKSVEYSGTPEELSVVLSQVNKSDNGYPQLLQWASKLQRLQPFFWVGTFTLLSIWLLIWATKPGTTYYRYQPQSQEARYEQPA